MFPSTEAVLLEARAGAFAGCISATANLNADLCARAWTERRHRRARRRGDDPQAVRRQAAGLRRQGAAGAHPRRPGLGARRSRRSAPFAAADRAAVVAGYDAVRAPQRRARAG